MKTVFVAKRK